MLQFNKTGLHQGDIVIASFVEKPEKIRDNRVYVIVSNKGLLIKRCFNRLDPDNKLICNSDNQESNYSPILLGPDEIKEVWGFEANISRKIPD